MSGIWSARVPAMEVGAPCATIPACRRLDSGVAAMHCVVAET